MRPMIVAAVVLLSLAGCATSATTATSGPPVMTSPTSAASRPPSPTTPTLSAARSSTPSTNTPSRPTVTAGTFDVLPAGYTYAYLTRLTSIGGRWAVVLDPLTVCTYPSKDPGCADLTEEPPNGYEIRNLSTKAYVVPLAPGTVMTVIGPSGQPDDFVTLAMAEKSWASDEIVVAYTVNAAQQVATIKEWWRP